MQLSEFLKKYREATDVSRRVFAEKIGVSMHSLERWENKGAIPAYSQAKKISDYFGISDLENITKDEFELCVSSANEWVPKKITPEVNESVVREGNNADYKTPKDLLIEEKDKRIADLEKLVARLEDTIELMKKLVEKDDGGVSPF